MSFDLDPMTLVLKLDLDIVKMYKCTTNEVPNFSISKIMASTNTQTGTQADTQTDPIEIITYQHMEMVIILSIIS